MTCRLNGRRSNSGIEKKRRFVETGSLMLRKLNDPVGSCQTRYGTLFSC